MTFDGELLRRYAENKDEAAFAEVVRRYVDLAYSAAVRVLGGDRHLAQDVVQSVFTDLARKAASLSRHTTLSGWLHTSVRYAALDALRGERRRQIREQEAATMNQISSTAECSWEQLSPLLDEAVGCLDETDRNAVIMRFFQDKSHQEIGQALGLNEDTARKRVERAVEKLRTHFFKRGVTVSTGLLAESISANSVQAAPTGLANTLASIAFANAGSTGISGPIPFILNMTTKNKIIVAALCLLCAVTLSIYAIFPAANGQWEKPTFPLPPSKSPSTVLAPSLPPVNTAVATASKILPSARGETSAREEPSVSSATGSASESAAMRLADLTDRIKILIQGKQVILGTSSDIWTSIPGRENAVELREGVKIISLEESYGTETNLYGSTVYYLPAENRFYIDWRTGPGGPNSGGCYGPFQGNPYDILDIPRESLDASTSP